MATLNAAVRDDSKRSVTKKLRLEGKIPAVIYGKTVQNASVSVAANELRKVFSKEGKNAVINLNVDNQKHYTVMAHELQYDHLKGSIQHIDFLQINVNEAIDAVVPVALKGVKDIEVGGVVVTNQLSELRVHALPANLPSTIAVDVSTMKVGDSLRIKDLAPDKNYEIVGDPEDVIVSVAYGGQEASEPAAPAASEESTPAAE
ncbi:MAG: 50S ribosomal protein L25 [Sporolactobacillus sp.]|jgi:large subunit ribosomal protein L25|nr:50S ribosomal protein L25 [Sporolactobacillus sp.]MCI1881003.1 50S ribosomal protein L25 [Sporolactobacillus sp.]